MPHVAQKDIFAFADSVDLLIVFGHPCQGGIDVAWSKFREHFPNVDALGEPFTSSDSEPHEYAPGRFVVTVAEEHNHGMSEERLRRILEHYFHWAKDNGLRRVATNGIMDIDHAGNTDANRASDDRRALFMIALTKCFEQNWNVRISLSSINDVFMRAGLWD